MAASRARRKSAGTPRSSSARRCRRSPCARDCGCMASSDSSTSTRGRPSSARPAARPPSRRSRRRSRCAAWTCSSRWRTTGVATSRTCTPRSRAAARSGRAISKAPRSRATWTGTGRVEDAWSRGSTASRSRRRPRRAMRRRPRPRTFRRSTSPRRSSISAASGSARWISRPSRPARSGASTSSTSPTTTRSSARAACGGARPRDRSPRST